MFQRGVDPKIAMGYAHITWDNLCAGCVLSAKKLVRISPRDSYYVFTTDGQTKSNWIYERNKMTVKSIIRSKYKSTDMLEIELHDIDRSLNPYLIKGPLERFKSRFKILQKDEIEKTLDNSSTIWSAKPMSSPTGQLFYFDYKYDSGKVCVDTDTAPLWIRKPS